MARKNIVSAYLTSILGIFSGVLTQFVYVKLLTSRVSLDEYSLYAFVFQITNYIAFFQLGLDFATSREIAFCLGKNDAKAAGYSFGVIKRFNNRLSAVGVIAVLSIILLMRYKNSTDESLSMLKIILVVFGFGFSQILSFFLNPYIVALIGSNNQKIINFNNFFLSVTATITSSILLYYSDIGILAMPLVLVLLNAINFFIIKKIALKKCSFIHLLDKNIKNAKEDKRILLFSLVTTVGGLAWTIEATSDVFILSGIGLFSLIGLYSIWWRFPQMLFDLATRLTSSSLPSLAHNYGQSETESNKLFNKLFLIILGFSLVIGIGVALWLPSFVKLWVGDKFYYSNFKIISIFCALIVANRILGNCFSMFITTQGKAKVTTKYSWIQAVVKVTLGVVLAKFFGLEGLLCASWISSLLQVILSFYYLYRNGCFLFKSEYLLPLPLIFPLIFIITGVPYFSEILQFITGSVVTLICSVLLWCGILFIGKYPNKFAFGFKMPFR